MRLKLIKRAVRELFGIDMRLHITTEMQGRMVAYEQWWNNHIEVLVNGNLVKTEEALVVAVAHGLAHKMANTERHTNIFYEKMKEVLDKLIDRLGLNRDVVYNEMRRLDKIAGLRSEQDGENA